MEKLAVVAASSLSKLASRYFLNPDAESVALVHCIAQYTSGEGGGLEESL